MNQLVTDSNSAHLFVKAKHYIPGGVNSPVRAFGAVGGHPLFFSAAEGAYLIDADQQQFIDYVGSWGPMILGHAHPNVVKAVQETAQRGLSFGAPCEAEIELARLICELMPAIEKVRFVSSGTEAAMTAIRLARGVTQRSKIIKFAGCYHGHSDSLLVNAGSGALTFGVPSSPGIPNTIAEETLVASFNDLDSVAELFNHYGNNIAAIIIEPIAANMNLVLPKPNFLSGLRELCNQYGALLIFDEVITGFRVALGGAQSIYNVKPDLIILGKIIGGGLPVGAVGGKKEWMDQLAPIGPIYQAGTLSGNPVAMAAGIATLKEIQRPNFYSNLSAITQKLVTGLNALGETHKLDFHANCIGSLFGFYFTEEKNIKNLQQIKQCNQHQFKTFFHGMLREGIYLAPSSFEVGFVSSAHGEEEIAKTLKGVEKVFYYLLTP